MKVEVVFSWTEERDETRGDRSHLHSYHSYRGIDYLSERAKRVCVCVHLIWCRHTVSLLHHCPRVTANNTSNTETCFAGQKTRLVMQIGTKNLAGDSITGGISRCLGSPALGLNRAVFTCSPAAGISIL